jgi:hypothetical protein
MISRFHEGATADTGLRWRAALCSTTATASSTEHPRSSGAGDEGEPEPAPESRTAVMAGARVGGAAELVEGGSGVYTGWMFKKGEKTNTWWAARAILESVPCCLRFTYVTPGLVKKYWGRKRPGRARRYFACNLASASLSYYDKPGGPKRATIDLTSCLGVRSVTLPDQAMPCLELNFQAMS